MWWPSCPYYEAFPPRRVNVPPLFACMLFFYIAFLPPPLCVPACLPFLLPTWLPAYWLPVYLLDFITAYLNTCLPFPYLSAPMPSLLPTWLIAYLSLICLPPYPSICLPATLLACLPPYVTTCLPSCLPEYPPAYLLLTLYLPTCPPVELKYPIFCLHLLSFALETLKELRVKISGPYFEPYLFIIF